MDLKSLLEQKKKILKPCNTVITSTDGRKYILSGGQSREIEGGLPFVVDTKPDMQVAMIVPGLFLSSQDPASNLETLNKYGIKHILSLGIEPGAKFEDIGYSFVDLLDLPESNITRAVKDCFQIINQHRKHNILVHCNAGVSRSATVVISYLMMLEKITYDEAYKRVKASRNCIRPNDGFVTQLRNMKFNN